jgi:hypothetical protein
MSEIKLIGLVTGEQLIVKVLDSTTQNWKVKTPVILMPMGEGKLGFAPWVPYADSDSIFINSDKIVFMSVPQTELLNKYNEAFGSGLIVPDTKVAAPKLTLVE